MTQSVAKTKEKPKRQTKRAASSARRSTMARGPSSGGGGKASAAPRKKTRTPKTRFGFTWMGLVKKTIYYGLVLGVWAAIAGLGVVAYYAYDLPDPNKGFAETRRPMVIVQAADGSEISRAGDLYGQAVRLSDLPSALPAAILATEDRRFYEHFGVDLIGLARAMVVNIQAGRIRQGGSTLTQQVAKNLFLTSERSIKRKVQEVLLALWLENKFSKDQILEVYLNRVYLGGGTYGVDAAAHLYFQRSARDLTVYQSAMIAGLLKAPSKLNPRANPEAAQKRTQQVLANMVAAGYLTAIELQQTGQGSSAITVRAPNGFAKYFTDWTLDQMGDRVVINDTDAVLRTTLDPALQRVAETAVRNALTHASDKNISQAAVIVIDGSGAVRAMIGGRRYAKSSFNRATDARRQPGSAFKPFVYLAGLEAGLRPDDILEDAPIQIGSWRPKNFSGGYQGPVTMDDALAKSINTVAVRVARRAGAARVVDVAERLGINRPTKADLSIALGTSEVSLLELAQAYVPFANGGQGVLAHGVHSVLADNGQLLYERSGGGPGTVVSIANVGRMNAMLARAIETGTGKAARPDGAPNNTVAGKTGTSQGYRDAWFVGYTTDRVVAVWVGNDDASPMNKVTGGSVPAQIAKVILTKAQGARPWQLLPGMGGSIDLDGSDQSPVSLPGLLKGVMSLFGDGTSGAPTSATILPPTFNDEGRGN